MEVSMSLAKVIITSVTTMPVTGTIRDAASIMRDQHIGSVVITDKNVPLGIVTDRDLALHIGQTKEFDQNQSITRAMSKTVLMCRDSDDIFDTINRMNENNLRRMPVVNEENELVGIITSDDLLRLVSKELRELSMIFDKEMDNEFMHYDPSGHFIPIKESGQVAASF